MNQRLNAILSGVCIYLVIFAIHTPDLHAQCWRLVWADEFNDASAEISRTNWSFGSGNNYDCIHYYTDRSENATISNGTLKIIAREESYMGLDYTSAFLYRKDKIGWRYGRIEASIKFPSTPGFVPAFWMMPSDDMYGWWPNSGEIDIMEYVTTNPYLTHGGVHFEGGNSPGTTYVPDAETAFHVYAIEWTEEKIEFYVDGTNFLTVDNEHAGSETWPFDQPFYVILNLAVGGGWCGPPTAETVFPAIMEVDYVRAYQDLDNISISGRGFIHYYLENETYSVPKIEDATYSWTVPGHASIISGQHSNQIGVDWDIFGGEVIAEVKSGTCNKIIEYPVNVSHNFLLNSGFEKGTKYWVSRISHLVDASMIWTTEETHSGDGSVEAYVQTLGDNTWDIQFSQQDLEIVSGQQYEISFWAKTDANTRSISAAVINTSTYFVYGGETFTLNTDWTQYTFQFTASASAVVTLNIDLGLTAGRFYLDDFAFTTPELSRQNLIINPDFTTGNDDWYFITLGGSDAEGRIENGEYGISIRNGGTYTWDIHLGQDNLSIVNGKEYTVSFDAYAASPRTIYTIVGMNTDPWSVYHSDQTFSLTSNKQTFTYSFTMTHPTNHQARFGFDVGASSVNVYLDNVRLMEKTSSDIDHSDNPNVCERFELYQNTPNPFNPNTTIRFDLTEASEIQLDLYDIRGRIVTTLADGSYEAGGHSVKLDSRELASGVYFVKLYILSKVNQANSKVFTKKIMLLK